MKKDLQKNLEHEAASSLLALVGSCFPMDSNNNNTSKNNFSSSSSNATSDESIDSSSKIRVNKKVSTRMTFPMILMTVLDDPSNSDVITFLPSGTSFAIIQPTVFVSDLMPKHFNMVNFRSFIGRLNRWGFCQVKDQTRGDCEVYQHPLFSRGKWGLCRKMKCVTGDSSRDAMKSTARASSPTSVINQLSMASALPQSQCSTRIDKERKQQVCLSLEKELADQLVLPKTIKDQHLKNREPVLMPLHNHLQQSKQFQMESIPQRIVDNATNKVLEAAFEVLARDKDHVRTASQLPSHLPVLSDVSNLNNMAWVYQRSKEMGDRNCLMNANDICQGRGIWNLHQRT